MISPYFLSFETIYYSVTTFIKKQCYLQLTLVSLLYQTSIFLSNKNLSNIAIISTWMIENNSRYPNINSS